MQTIWITGGKGFIGRHLADYAAHQGCRVLGVGHGLWAAGDAARWSYSDWCNGEIESSNLSNLAGISGAPDAIFHLAGGSSVGSSFQSPQEDFTRTVATTARLLEWVRLNAPRARIVCASSAAVYGAGHEDKIAEEMPVSPYSPYGFHKAMMENLCRSYGENFGVQTVVVRLFSVYGPGLEKQLIWDLCSKLMLEDAVVTLGGTGREVRDWLHVSDAVRLLWMTRDKCSRNCIALNGGTGMGTTVADVASLVCLAWGTSSSLKFSGLARAGDPPRLVADTSRAACMGFNPVVRLEEGIRRTVEWVKERGANH